MKKLLIPFLLVACSAHTFSQALYEIPGNARSRISSFENPNGEEGKGGKTNKGAKGNAFEVLYPGKEKTLLDIDGPGLVNRIWLTVNRSPKMLRSLRLQIFWEDKKHPAVDVPLGDFFLQNLGQTTSFQTALFTSGEGRSFNCYIPMPFKRHARIVLINEGTDTAKVFYDVDFLRQPLPNGINYFHAIWSRRAVKNLGDDVECLPEIKGKGRFLGMSVALLADPVYGKSWWGEGEVKMYLDDDKQYPTYVGTGAEDYIGSAWGLGTFNHQYQGCLVASEEEHRFCFYRFHIPDPVYFDKKIRVTWQQIGGAPLELLRQIAANGARLQPVTVDGKDFVRLLDKRRPPDLKDKDFPNGWVNFYRMDDYAVTSYFYLDEPENDLPALAPLETRLSKIN